MDSSHSGLALKESYKLFYDMQMEKKNTDSSEARAHRKFANEWDHGYHTYVYATITQMLRVTDKILTHRVCASVFMFQF